MKNAPTNLYSDDGNRIVIRTWESGGGEMPRKAQKAISEFKILIDDEELTVYYNQSTKAQIDYYYLNYQDRWHWTRDNIRAFVRYRTQSLFFIELNFMDTDKDAYGQQLLAQLESENPTAEIIERDDNYLDFGSDAGLYFTAYEQWTPLERQALALARGRILDVGCGAGRHSLWLQEQGFDVTGIDNSPGAIEVCRRRGLKKALVSSIHDVERFAPASFDTILMFGNNFGLFGDAENARSILTKFALITTPDAQIIAGTRNPYRTDDPNHLAYHELNRKRGRMPGQIKMRVRYGKTVGDWFDYLFVAPEEMHAIIAPTEWHIKELIAPEKANYFAVICKNP